MNLTGASTNVSNGKNFNIESSNDGISCPSALISLFAQLLAGKFPSARTISSPCPISIKILNNSGDKLDGIPFNITTSHLSFYLLYQKRSEERRVGKECR